MEEDISVVVDGEGVSVDSELKEAGQSYKRILTLRPSAALFSLLLRLRASFKFTFSTII